MLNLDNSTPDQNKTIMDGRLELIKGFCHLLIMARFRDHISWDEIDEILLAGRIVGERKSPRVKV